MKTYVRNTLSGLLLVVILGGSFWLISPKNVEAESRDVKIPSYVQGKQFTIDYGNGDKLTKVSVVDVIPIDNEPWWRVAVSTSSGKPGVVYLTVNPRQIRALEGLP
jgi:hypothetical protein